MLVESLATAACGRTTVICSLPSGRRRRWPRPQAARPQPRPFPPPAPAFPRQAHLRSRDRGKRMQTTPTRRAWLAIMDTSGGRVGLEQFRNITYSRKIRDVFSQRWLHHLSIGFVDDDAAIRTASLNPLPKGVSCAVNSARTTCSGLAGGCSRRRAHYNGRGGFPHFSHRPNQTNLPRRMSRLFRLGIFLAVFTGKTLEQSWTA